jgi:nucleotide-binding universal stress UspA family protein
MIKHVLVSTSNEAGDAAVFATALQVATPFAAHLAFLHVGLDVAEMVVAMSASGGTGAQGVVDELEAASTTQQSQAWQAFAAFCAQVGIPTDGKPTAQGISADLIMDSGETAQILADHGRFADLIVLGRGHDGEIMALDVIEAAIMETGRPVLIASAIPPANLLETVAIAWENTPEAARAVFSAMPLLEHASQIVILSVTSDPSEPDTTCTRLEQALRWHNTNVSIQHLAESGREPVDVLLEEAGSRGATLLVMGAYSRSRLRETLFGGFTKHVLERADLPVLLAH